jgi:FkbM family methyltransferase
MIPQFLVPAGRQILGADYICALDIGGAYGLQPHWERFVGNSIFYMFEPHQESYQELLERYKSHPFGHHFRPLPYALAEKDGPTVFYATNCSTGSSLLKPNTKWRYHSPDDPYYYPLREIPIDGVSLKTALDSVGVADVDVVKMDIQGPELAVLRGLDERRMERILLVEMEVLFEPFYENSSKLADVETFMTGFGFDLYDIRAVRSARKISHLNASYNEKVFGVSRQDPSIAQKIGEVDLVYFRKHEPLIQAGDISKLNKLLFTFCVYNFFGEAAMIADDMKSANLIDEAKHTQLVEIIVLWQRINKEFVKSWEQVLQATDNQVYAQYSWVPFPSS